MKIGFVGAGTITRAMVEGLSGGPSTDLEMILSPRGEAVSRHLAETYPDQVRRVSSNQAVLDDADIVVLAVRPQIVREVCSELRFRADHLVLSVVATLSATDLEGLAAPARRLVRAVPLPFVAQRAGPTPVIPPDPICIDLFDRIGTAIGVENEETYRAMAAATAIMSSHLAFAATVENWLTAQGLPAADAARFVRPIFSGLSLTASREEEISLTALSSEHETVGGLNEQLRRTLEEAGVFTELGRGLDALLERIRGSGSPRSTPGQPVATEAQPLPSEKRS